MLDEDLDLRTQVGLLCLCEIAYVETPGPLTIENFIDRLAKHRAKPLVKAALSLEPVP